MRVKRHSDAVQEFKYAIELKPDYADAYFHRGNVHALIGDDNQANINFNKVFEIDPNNQLLQKFTRDMKKR